MKKRLSDQKDRPNSARVILFAECGSNSGHAKNANRQADKQEEAKEAEGQSERPAPLLHLMASFGSRWLVFILCAAVDSDINNPSES